MNKSLARLDLNLLFTLQLLLKEHSVSKTAKKLNVTPSTVSKSLRKLRDWFDDPLFVKTPQGFIPTQLALSLEADLADWLQMGSQLLDKRSDEVPKGVQFDLAMESPLLLTLFSELSQQIYQQYPQAKVKVHNWDYDAIDAIICGDVDLGFCGRESHPRSKESLDLLPYFIEFEVLFTDLPVVYLRSDHPALQEEWNMATFLKYAHINITWEKSETWALDDVVMDLGFTRNIALTMASFEQSLFMAAQPQQEMLTIAPQYCQQYITQMGFELTSLPLPLDSASQEKMLIPFTLFWHKRNRHNTKIQWLRNTIKSIYNENSSG